MGLPKRVGPQTALLFRVGPDERHTRDLLVLLGALEQQTVVAQVISVIGGKDLDRIFRTA